MRNTVEELKQETLDEEQCWQAVLTSYLLPASRRGFSRWLSSLQEVPSRPGSTT